MRLARAAIVAIATIALAWFVATEVGYGDASPAPSPTQYGQLPPLSSTAPPGLPGLNELATTSSADTSTPTTISAPSDGQSTGVQPLAVSSALPRTGDGVLPELAIAAALLAAGLGLRRARAGGRR